MRKPDLAFLYADPLVYLDNFTLKPIDAPLDTEIEFRQIFEFLKNCKKQFVIRKDAANFEVLKQVIASKPKIIHITCHGDYEAKLNEFYLAFEEKDTGVLDKLNEKRITELLGDSNNHEV